MKNKLFRFPLAFAATVFAVTVVAAALIGHLNVIQIRLSGMNRIERDEVDDIVTAFMLVVAALVPANVCTARREEREARRQTEQRGAERAEYFPDEFGVGVGASSVTPACALGHDDAQVHSKLVVLSGCERQFRTVVDDVLEFVR
jgi:hypothetical protein